MNNKVFVSFQHYDEKGRRLSLFGEIHENHIRVVEISCSKVDQFSKKIGRMLYYAFKGSEIPDLPQQISSLLIPKVTTHIIEGNTKKDFIFWCNKTFYKVKYHYSDVPGIPVEASIVEKFKGVLLKKRNVIIKYLGK